jgi:hypothetical protein
MGPLRYLAQSATLSSANPVYEVVLTRLLKQIRQKATGYN